MTQDTTATQKPVLTKDEKLAKITANIKALQAKYDDILNDRIVAKAAKVVYLPSVGDAVMATHGRNTPTSQAKVIPGTVLSVKHPEVGEDGKPKGAIQVRVRIYEGTFDEQAITVYPGQLQPAPVEPASEEVEAAAE